MDHLEAMRFNWRTVLAFFVGLSCWALPALAQKDINSGDGAVISYTPAFAQRFALPETAPALDPPDGIQAMQFSIERMHNRGDYHICKFEIYVGSSLPIAYPKSDISGARYLTDSAEHFFLKNDPGNKRWLSMSIEDRRYFGSQDTYLRAAGFASSDLQMPTRGHWTELFYESFYQNLFPGLSYIALGGPCELFIRAQTVPVVQLWLKQVGGRDYRQIVVINPSDFLKFTIPPAFLSGAFTLAKVAAERNGNARKNGGAK